MGAGYGLSDTEQGDNAADPDGDGLKTEEYERGTDPTEPTRMVMMLDSADDYLSTLLRDWIATTMGYLMLTMRMMIMIRSLMRTMLSPRILLLDF